MEKENKKLKEILEVVFLIASSQHVSEILEIIISKAKEIMEAEACSLLIVEPETGELVFQIAQGARKEVVKGFRVQPGEGIVGWVAQNGKSEIIHDVQSDPRHFKGVDQKSNFVTKNMICAPLKTQRDIIGTIQVVNKINGAFDEKDLYQFETLASQAAVAIENAMLREQATVDGLTKLYVRRYFDILLKEEFLRAKRKNEKITVALLDIDHFKNVNDTYGHQAGDEILQGVARIIKESCRENDIAARYGGEEFTMILPDTDEELAHELLDQMREKIEEEEGFLKEEKLKVTMSIGQATWPNFQANYPNELLKFADIALYQSKETGRNRVTRYKVSL